MASGILCLGHRLLIPDLAHTRPSQPISATGHSTLATVASSPLIKHCKFLPDAGPFGLVLFLPGTQSPTLHLACLII